jgi:hypothetical protein
MKIELEVSTQNECTDSPWWVIINPEQNFSKGIEGIHNIGSMITGPFFSREEAQDHLTARRYAFGTNACVYCLSGYWSRQYKEAYRKSETMNRKGMREGEMTLLAKFVTMILIITFGWISGGVYQQGDNFTCVVSLLFALALGTLAILLR